MGRASKELKEVTGDKKKQEWPVKDKDYYVLIVKKGAPIPPGWLQHAWGNFSNAQAGILLKQMNDGKRNRSYGHEIAMFERRYALYPGPRPDKKWGPVCP